MKLQLSLPAGINLITAYGDGFVEVNRERRTASLILLPDHQADWPVARFEDLAAGALAGLVELRPSLVLLGTGRRHRFPHPDLYRDLDGSRAAVSELGLVGLYVWLLLIYSSFRDMAIVQKYARGTEFATYAELMQLSLVGFFVSAFFLSRTYNEVLYIIIAVCTLLSYYARDRFGYSQHLFPMRLLMQTLVFMIGLIAAIKVLVMI